MRLAVVALLMVIACGGEQATTTTTSESTSTTIAPTSTTTTTTTTLPTTTTTTIPTGPMDVYIDVYDEPGGSVEVGEPCELGGGTFNFVVPNTQVILEDANTGEVLSVTAVGAGSRQYEDVFGEVPNDVAPLFWYCSFQGSFSDVPLDRDFYKLRVEGDVIIGDGITIDGNDVREFREVGTTYFYTDSEDIRASYR